MIPRQEALAKDLWYPFLKLNLGRNVQDALLMIRPQGCHPEQALKMKSFKDML